MIFCAPTGGAAKPLAADLDEHGHVPLRFFQALRPGRVVVDDPLGEADRAFDREAEVANPLAEILERVAAA